MIEANELKAKLLSLLREDEEFRYAVAGYIGLAEVLRRLEEHDRKFNEILARLDRHEEILTKHTEELTKHTEELAKLREDMNAGFKRHDEEIAKLREDMNAGFKRHDEEIAKLREDMNAGFKRHDEEIAKLREDMMIGFKRHDEEFARLREDMNRGFMLIERHISALGARWGLMAEEAFREGLEGLLGKEFGFTVEKWRAYDEDGRVFGYPSEVEVDIAVKDGKVILIEVASHVKASDVYQLRRKAELYMEKTGRKPDRLLIVTPYVDDKALEASKRLNIEVYTRV
ncbi:MAG: DUF3782 domain-containing protein [Candidatus Bathyarchaeia archaeon]